MNVPESDILRYIGVKIPDESIVKKVAEATDAVLKVAEPKGVYKKFAYRNGVLTDINYRLQGKDIIKHLGNADEVVVMAVTLGLKVDIETARLNKISETRAFLFDAAASAAIEAFADEFTDGIAAEIGSPVGDRFSPGYGDLPISIQRDIQTMLSADTKIGLAVEKNHTLIPLKSITAIAPVGVKRCLHHDCKKCNKTDCAFRKE